MRTPTCCLGALPALGLLLACAAARACIGDQLNSVHFHSEAVDFGTPPLRACVGDFDDRPIAETEWSGSQTEERVGVELRPGPDAAVLAREKALADKLAEAARYLAAGRWTRALAAYQWVGGRYGWWGNLRDRVEVLQEVLALRRPTPVFLAALRTYLRAMATYDATTHLDALTKAGPDFQRVAADPAAGFLRGHAVYQLASLDWEVRQLAQAATEYQRFLAAFPRSPKREAALIMLARCTVLLKSPTAQELATGANALARLRREFPGTRFASKIAGLRARVLLLTGRYREAADAYFALGDLASVEAVRDAMPSAQRGFVRARLLAGYLHRLAAARTWEAYQRAITDIRRSRRSLSPADAARFADLLMAQPALLAPYFYFRLYLCSNKPTDLANLASLADRAAARHGAGSLPPLVRARLAEVYYQRRQYARALEWADRSLATGLLDRGLYMRGSALHKLRRYAPAIASFRELLRRFPASPLVRGAREELAIACEDAGDLPAALDEYFTLGYTPDIAFLVDARMTTREVQDYLRRYPDRVYDDATFHEYDQVTSQWDHGRRTHTHPVLAYSLGIRFTRQERWAEAAHWLRLVPRAEYRRYSAERDGGTFDEGSPDPLTAVRELGRLQRAAARAHDGNARAAALYAYATYYYKHGTLLLYNGALWRQNRAMCFAFYWNKAHATREDRLVSHQHMSDHEVYAHTLRICREIARKYPRSPVAPRALYRAACAAEKLSNFNEWWRTNEDGRQHLTALSIGLMRQVAGRYPRSSLAHEAGKFAGVWSARERM